MNDPNLRVLHLHTPRDLRAALERVGADSSERPVALAEQVARAQFQILQIERASLPLARLLYQELTMEGGQVITAPRLEHVGEGETDVLLCATRYQYNHLLVRLRWQPSEDLQYLADKLERALDNMLSPPPALTLGATTFDWARPYIMGILNLTPDSFSGDALVQPDDTERDYVTRSVEQAQQRIAEGADILDLGGESTRPNAAPVPLEIELQRVLPVVRALQETTNIPLSIDTSKAAVADAALNAGAHFVNDVTGLRGDREMKRVVAAHQAPIVLMHNRMHGARPANVDDIMGVIIAELRTQIDAALDAGIAAHSILVDPGLGFGKTPTENLEILNRLAELRVLGLPILIGPSRKGFISKAINVPTDQREEGAAAAISIGIANGANIARVHNVPFMTRIAQMTNAILKAQIADRK